MEYTMSTMPLASIKKTYGITDDLPIKFEQEENELILHIPLNSTYSDNDKIIDQARNLVHQRKKQGWTRQDFFNDFMKVREEVLKKVRAFYVEK